MANAWIEITAYIVVLLAAARPLGGLIAKILSNEHHVLSRPLGWLERCVYKASGINPNNAMTWWPYARALLVFNAVGVLLLVALQMFQQHLPLNPAQLPAVGGWLAFNTAISFVTNTNWQAYSGEATMSYLTQMLGLGVQNFLSAGTGIAVMAALARGLTRQTTLSLGNFWADLTRSVVYILLPLSLVFALILMSQGVIQNFSHYLTATGIDGGVSQTIPMGPAASQIAIKQLGTNGGGFFGVNSAHPFENPTPFSNALEMLALLLIPCSLPIAFGRLVGNRRHGATLFATMLALFLVTLAASLWFEFNASTAGLALLEGKETRFGIGSSVLWSVATTVSSNGSVNAMHSSLSPLSGGIAMLNIMLGEVVFGGVGSGVYGMVLFVILAVFIAGLMVGRSPEYCGKKIEAREIKLAVIAILAPSVMILAFSAIACLSSAGLASVLQKGPHGLSEILYAFSSAAGNNGSAFAGLNANTPFYNALTAIAMLIGRYAVIVPILAIAGSLAAKRQTPTSSGTFATDGPLFAILLASTISIVGALTFIPALSLGPIMEHVLMLANRSM